MKISQLRPGVFLAGIIALQTFFWLPWAFLTPFIFGMARRFPLAGGAPFRHGALHLGLGVLLGCLFQVYNIISELLLYPTPDR